MKENNSITSEDIKARILKGISEVFRGKTIYMKDIEEDVEQYAQAKVLEALEPQKELIEELLTIFDGNGVPNIRYVTRLIKEYYETEVKPKQR